MKWFSGGILLVALALLFFAVNSTLAQATKDALRTKLREARELKWNLEIAGALLEAALEAILVPHERKASWFRLPVIGLLLLTMSLGAIGWQTGTLLGLKEPPWEQYQQVAEEFGTFKNSPRIDPRAPDAKEQWEARRAIEQRMKVARAPAFKYIYTVVVIIWIGLINHLMLFLSVLATLHFVRETKRSPSWTQRAGLMLLLMILSIVLGNIALFVVGLLHNPVSWATMILGGHVSLGTLFLLIVGSNLFSWFLSDPWLSALIVAPLLPALVLLLLVTPALLSDIRGWALRSTHGLILHSVVLRMGSRGIAFLMTALALFAIIAVLQLLPFRS